MVFLSLKLKMIMYLFKKAQIILLLTKKVRILAKYYTDFLNIFSKKKTLVLPN